MTTPGTSSNNAGMARRIIKPGHNPNNRLTGLTFGIHSRIQSRIEQVATRIKAGNIYVNRNMIGAVVGVQPFGGRGLSGTGPKAGGPLYLHQFAHERSLSNDITASGGNTDLMSLDYL